MKVNIGLSLVGVVIGEFLAARHGLGYLIIYGSQVLQLDMLITSILLLCIIAMGLYQLLQFAEHCYKKKCRTAQSVFYKLKQASGSSLLQTALWMPVVFFCRTQRSLSENLLQEVSFCGKRVFTPFSPLPAG